MPFFAPEMGLGSFFICFTGKLLQKKEKPGKRHFRAKFDAVYPCATGQRSILKIYMLKNNLFSIIEFPNDTSPLSLSPGSRSASGTLSELDYRKS